MHHPTDLWYLRHLIAALDRRLPQAPSTAEVRIARESAALRAQAVVRIAEIEAELEAGPGPQSASRTLA
jgi:hypothetical protein